MSRYDALKKDDDDDDDDPDEDGLFVRKMKMKQKMGFKVFLLFLIKSFSELMNAVMNVEYA